MSLLRYFKYRIPTPEEAGIGSKKPKLPIKK